MERSKTPKADLAALIAALGPSAMDVYLKLVELNCKGVVGDACNCPIAQYLAMNGRKYHRATSNQIEDTYATIATPTHIGEFIRMFDRRAFPKLIA